MLKSYSPHLRACGGQDARLRRASRAPCLWLRPVSHARGCFRVWARVELLFSRAGQKPVSCSLRQGESPPQTSINEKNVGPNVPQRTETPEKLSFAPWLFGRFPASRRFAAEWPLKPASSEEKGRSAKGRRRPPRTETLEKLSFAPWLFKRFPYLPAVCGPKGRVSRPAARGKGRSAAGHRNGVQRGEALLRIFVYFLFGRK